MHVEILKTSGASTVEMTVHEPLPRVPAWIRLQTYGDRPQFWTLPPGHYLERTEGRYGCPREMATTARRYLAGDIDQDVAETEFTKSLAGWSQSTA